jgi:uncharacterized protein involved in exopolysaccharide biosynthesis
MIIRWDRKFVIALIIMVILLLSLSYFLFIKPKYEVYVKQIKVDAQLEVINYLINQVEINGYSTITNENNQTYIVTKVNGEKT